MFMCQGESLMDAAERQVNTNVHAYCVKRCQSPKQAEAIIVFVYTVTMFLSGDGAQPLRKPFPH